MKKTFIKLLIGFGLFILGCGLFLIELSLAGGGFSSIEKIEDPKTLNENFRGSMLKGQKIQGEFLASDNYLGSIKVKFDSLNRLNDDVLIFRIREIGKPWFYENNYPVRQFYSLPLYPFGFPLQQTSKAKTYQFEFESKYGNGKNSAVLDLENPMLITRYTYNQKTILHTPISMIDYGLKKIITSLTFKEKMVAFFIYQIPLQLYLITLFLLKIINLIHFNDLLIKAGFPIKLGKKTETIAADIILSVCIFLEILFVNEQASFIVLIILSGIIFVTNRSGFTWKNNIYSAIIYLGIALVLSVFKLDIYADRFMAWVYLFILGGTVSLFCKTYLVSRKFHK